MMADDDTSSVRECLSRAAIARGVCDSTSVEFSADKLWPDIGWQALPTLSRAAHVRLAQYDRMAAVVERLDALQREAGAVVLAAWRDGDELLKRLLVERERAAGYV